MTRKLIDTLNGLKQLLTKEQTQILRVAGLLMVPALLTKATGLLFTLLTSTSLGVGNALDSFLYANELPAFLAEVILTGAISTLVIPIFIQAKQDSSDIFMRFYNTVINLLLGGFAVVSIVVILFASPIFDFTVNYIIQPDNGSCLYLYMQRPEKYQQAVDDPSSKLDCTSFAQNQAPFVTDKCVTAYFNNPAELNRLSGMSQANGGCAEFVQQVAMRADASCLYYYYNDTGYYNSLQDVSEEMGGCANFSVSQIVSMMRVLMIPQLILGLSVFVASGLNVYNRFLIPQLAPLFYNVGRIFSVFILLPLARDYFGPASVPWALVAGVLIGSVLHLLVQIPLARMLGLKFIPVIDLSLPYLQNFIAVSIPRLIAYAADSLGAVLNRLIISGFNSGFLSTMFYASALANMIPGVIGYAFSVASYPTLSRLYQQGKYKAISDVVINMLNQIIFLAIPVILSLMILRLPAVRLSLGLLPGTGFDRVATLMVAWTLLFLSIGIIFTTVKWYLYRLFYVAQNTVIPFFVSFFSLGVTIVITNLFANFFSHASQFSIGSIPLEFSNFFTAGDSLAAVGGAALAISVSAFIEVIILLIIINSTVVKLDFKSLFGRLAKKAIPTLLTALLMYFMYSAWDTLSFPIDAEPDFSGSTTFNLFLLTGVTASTSFMVYYLLCYLFGVEELKILRKVLNPVFKLGGLTIK